MAARARARLRERAAPLERQEMTADVERADLPRAAPHVLARSAAKAARSRP
jgi:hypothetical protein